MSTRSKIVGSKVCDSSINISPIYRYAHVPAFPSIVDIRHALLRNTLFKMVRDRPALLFLHSSVSPKSAFLAIIEDVGGVEDGEVRPDFCALR